MVLCFYKGHIKLEWDKEWDLRASLELCHQGPCQSWGEKLAGTEVGTCWGHSVPSNRQCPSKC